MKAFITDMPLLFAIGITVLGSLVEFLALSAGGLAGLPEPALILIALLVSVAISLGFDPPPQKWSDSKYGL